MEVQIRLLQEVEVQNHLVAVVAVALSSLVVEVQIRFQDAPRQEGAAAQNQCLREGVVDETDSAAEEVESRPLSYVGILLGPFSV